jgi:hypothetical protein
VASFFKILILYYNCSVTQSDYPKRGENTKRTGTTDFEESDKINNAQIVLTTSSSTRTLVTVTYLGTEYR